MPQKIKNKIKLLKVYLSVIALLVPSLGIVAIQSANASTLTTSYIRLNRLSAGATTSFRLQFKAASSQTANVVIDFNGADSTTWTGSSGVVNGTQTVTTATCASETGDIALPGSITASGSGSAITITSVGATTSGVTYCADLTSASAVTNATAGEYHPTITIGTDTTTVAARTIANDQIVVNATVSPTFNFVLSGTTDNFASNLNSSSVVSTSGQTLTITTNATGGWIAWAKDLNGSSGSPTMGGLKSATASNHTIPTTNGGTLGAASHTLSTGSEDYGLGVTITTNNSGTALPDAAYDGASSKAGILDPTNFRVIANATSPANGDVVNLKERATISGTTPAANDYTDTITTIGAGSF